MHIELQVGIDWLIAIQSWTKNILLAKLNHMHEDIRIKNDALVRKRHDSFAYPLAGAPFTDML